MRNFFLIITLLVALILVCGCTGTTAEPGAPIPEVTTATPGAVVPTATADVQDYTFTQTITYTDENGTTVITKNKLAKTATIDATLRTDPVPDGFNQTRYYELFAGITGNLMRMAFFNETALEEFNAQVAAWNAQEYTVQDDSPPEQRETVPGENPLKGYTVQRATVRLQDQGTGAGIADIVITGPDIEDVAITYL